MNKFSIILTLFSIGLIFSLSTIPDSEAKLWDFLIDVEFTENPIGEGTKSVLIGTVVDHGYNPVYNIDIKINFAGESYILKTDRHGEFGKELDARELKPRTYSLHVLASSDDGKKGMTRTTLEIDGHTEKSAKFDRELDYMNMVNDSSKLRNNSNDPISVILYQHYLELQDKMAQAQHEEKLLEIPQQKIREARELSHQKLMEELEKRPLVTRGIDDSTKLGKFLQNLDDDKRTLFELQLNSTKIRFIEAQNIMQNILKNGGTVIDARIGYLNHLSITQEEMNLFIENMEKSNLSPKPLTNSTEN
tara:strand:- start:67 stop:981 length:915 start_codon:yes stop_codon:yes gene_type:complete